MSITSLQKAVDLAGGQTALAEKLRRPGREKIGQKHVHRWLTSPNPDQSPPAEYCPDIEAATGVTCEELRPDVNWHVLRRPPESHTKGAQSQ